MEENRSGISVLEIKNLTKTYGKARGVEKVCLQVEKGDIFGYLGPNGAGKSTTIRSMLGFLNDYRGEIRIFDMDAKRDREKILRKIGYMPSEALFYPSMKVKEVIRFAAETRGMDCKEESSILCEKLQVDVNKKISDLSLGNRKKVSIVCAMQHKPELFIFDEPTSGLDPLIQSVFFELIEEYVKGGATCLLSTHVLSEVKSHCNKVAIMKEGKLMCVDTVENLTKTNAKRIKMIRDGEKVDMIYRGDLNKISDLLVGHDIADLLIEEPSIDEIFMQYYTDKE